MRSRRHNSNMPPRRSADTTLDLFSDAPAEPVASPGKPYRDNAAPHLRHLLPKDLAGALKRLDDAELAVRAVQGKVADHYAQKRPEPAALQRRPLCGDLISLFFDHLQAHLSSSRKAKLSGGGGHHIDYAPTHEGTSVVDPNHDGTTSPMIGDAHLRSKRQ